MARKIFASSAISTDGRVAKLAEVDERAALAWPWVLWSLDDWARVEDDAQRLLLETFPAFRKWDASVVGEIVDRLVEHGLLQRYEAGGRSYLSVRDIEKWWAYQTHIHKSKREADKSKCPAPPAGHRATPRESAEHRDSPRWVADLSGIGTKIVPSPSPSPSKETSPTRVGVATSQVSLGVGEPAAAEPHQNGAAPKKRALSSQQARAQAIVELFPADLNHPAFGLVGKWLAQIGFERLRELILMLGPKASLGDRFAFLAGCVNRVARELTAGGSADEMSDLEREAMRAMTAAAIIAPSTLDAPEADA